ncbi:MAG TPA: hypothetical protein VFF84_02725 [Sphingobium sp.]|nr:hypothetical protein [Sphingobium sp.]
MGEDYIDQLLLLAAKIVALADVESTLDKREWKAAKEQHDSLEAKFKEIRNKYVDVLLDTSEGHDQAYDLVAADIAAIRANCDPSWNPAVNYVSDNLLSHLQKEAARDPGVRKAIKVMPWVLAGFGVTAYFAIRFLSATPINHAIDTREGIQERAAAVGKLLRYDEWMDTHVRKGGWIKGILLWPIQPTDAEIEGASEFAALAYEAQQLSVEQFGCPSLNRGYGNKPSKEELDYISEAADYLRRPNIQWKNPPVLAAMDAAKVVGNC